MSCYSNYIIDDFLKKKKFAEGISEWWLKPYTYAFRLLSQSKHMSCEDVKTLTIHAFEKLLIEESISKNWKSSTYNTYRNRYKCFCKYLVKTGYLEKNPFDEISKQRTPKSLPKCLSKERIQELFKAILHNCSSWKFLDRRNFVIIHMLLSTGLRRNELLNLKLSDIRLGDGVVFVEKGKWGKDRYVPIPSGFRPILLDYLTLRTQYRIPSQYLFPSVCREKLWPAGIRIMMDKICKTLSFHFSPHQLRHTYATELSSHNLNIYKIAQVLGHSDIKTTVGYLSCSLPRLCAEIDQLPLYKDSDHGALLW